MPGRRDAVTARERRRGTEPTARAVIERFTLDVAATIEARNLLKGGERVVLAVSGGADSLSMLHAIARIRERFALTLHVAHFDHRMRATSSEDSAFVEAQAGSLDVGCTVGVLEAEQPKGRSPEEHLRTERDRFLGRVAREVEAPRILTGHTRNDQAETVLLNLLFGAGRRGLGGMPPARWRLARPLIDRSRDETEAFCAALGLEPRRDETNLDPTFRRNRVRHEILPVLLAVNPNLVEQLAQLADVHRDEDFLLDALAGAAAMAAEDERGSSASLERLRAASLALRRRAIRLLARNEGVGLTFAQCEQLVRLVTEGRDATGIDLGGTLSARRADGLLTIGRDPDGAASS
jgi:tRNA(Ile)-lysidine synthase